MHDARDRNQGVWIEPSDRLYVAAYSSVASLVVQFSGYFRKANGEVIEYAVTVNPTSDRAVTENNVFFGAGFLLSCVATLASGNASRGQCYVRAMVQRSTGTPMVKLHTIVGGYLTDDFSPSFPYGQIEGPLEGAGVVRSITGTNPAAGAEISETVPTGAAWRPLSLVATLVTDATVATRRAILIFDDGTLTHTRMPQNTTSTATQSVILAWHIGSDIVSSGGTFGNAPLADHVRLPAGSRIMTSTNNIQAGDNWGAPQFLVEEWVEA